MSSKGASKGLKVVATIATTILGGSFVLGFLTSSVLEQINLFKKKKYGRSCQTCKAIGYHMCKLCKGSGMIQWSPLNDPIVINPCVCPTCDGFKVQRCLNCLGYGSA